MTQQESYNERPDGESNQRPAGCVLQHFTGNPPAPAAAIGLGEADLLGWTVHTST